MNKLKILPAFYHLPGKYGLARNHNVYKRREMSMENNTTHRYQTPRSVYIATAVMGVVILLISMAGFVNKLIEFFNVASGDAEGSFALTPMINYTLATIGFLLLLIWATLEGMFHSIEGPKHTMLEREPLLDRNESNYVPVWAGGPAVNEGKGSGNGH